MPSSHFSAAALATVLLSALTSCGVDEKIDEVTGQKTMSAASRGMEPTLPKGEEFTVRLVDHYEPDRGDVIVFDDSGGWMASEESGSQVKRVIGVPGDVITCCEPETGWLAVNGQALDETDYVMPDGTECAAPMTPIRCNLDVGPIPEGYLFVMGDNRSNSADSTAFMCGDTESDCAPERGLVPVDLVWGVWVD